MTLTRKDISGIVLAVGMLVILVGAVAPFFFPHDPQILYTTRWILAAGAVATLVARFLEPVIDKKESLRLNRLQRLDKVAAFIFVLSAAALFYTSSGEVMMSWVPLLMAGAIIQIYSTLMAGREAKKIAEESSKAIAKKKKNAKKQ